MVGVAVGFEILVDDKLLPVHAYTYGPSPPETFVVKGTLTLGQTEIPPPTIVAATGAPVIPEKAEVWLGEMVAPFAVSDVLPRTAYLIHGLVY